LVFLVISFLLAFPPITYMHPSSSPFVLHAPILLHFIILIILGEEYKLRSSSLCSFLHPLVALSLFSPNVILSTLFSNILILYVPPSMSETKFHNHTKPWT
jgi:hypothetical protein